MVESQNHRMVRVGKDHKDHLGPTPLSWAGMLSTGPSCSKSRYFPRYSQKKQCFPVNTLSC